MNLHDLITRAQTRAVPPASLAAGEAPAPHAQTIDAVLSSVEAGRHGLSREEAAARLVRFGPNALPRPKPTSLPLTFVRQFVSPLIYVLVAAALVALALRHYVDAAMIGAVLLVNAVIGTAQEFNAERSAEALRTLVPARALVVRGGERCEIDADSLVPGDVVLLEGGTKVPADLRLFETTGMEVDESLLTGESLPVTKDASVRVDVAAAVGDRVNMGFAATIVLRGRGRGVVVGTGARTRVGALASSLARAAKVDAPLIQRMRRFARKISVAVLVSVLLVAAGAAARGMSVYDIFLVCVALAVSAIPEGLPVALTVALSIAMRRMSRRHVIVRKLVAVEALGSCTYVATDKTGTLTVNEMAVTRAVVPGERAWIVSGSGTSPEGSVELPEEGDGATAMGVLARLAETAALCNEGFLGKRDGEWVHHGDAVDVALLAFAHKLGVSDGTIAPGAPRIGEIPFEPENRFAVTFHREGERTVAHVKGAVERLLPMCSSMATLGGDVALDEAVVLEGASALAEEGHRVLGLASGTVDVVEGGPFDVGHLRDLVFLGMVGMIDPLRAEAKAAVTACRAAGVEVAMITGDHPVTAGVIARAAGIAAESDQVVTGADLHAASQAGGEAFDALVRRARVFARVEPQQKLEVVQSLTRAGHFVAVTGDGANDAPALRAAHVGVAMGKRGTDVAREAASLIIADDDFASIVAGIEEGRVAYANVRKVVFLLVSSGATEVVLFLVAIGVGLPPPLLPAQLLWLNLVTNGIQDVALAFEPAEGDELKRPPRAPRESIFNRAMIERVALTAAIMGPVSVVLFAYLLRHGWSVDAARNALLFLLVLFENVQAGASRSETRPMYAIDPRRNPLLLFGVLVAFGLHLLVMAVPAMGVVLRTQWLSLEAWPVLFAASLLPAVALDVLKLIRRASRKVSSPSDIR